MMLLRLQVMEVVNLNRVLDVYPNWHVIMMTQRLYPELVISQVVSDVQIQRLTTTMQTPRKTMAHAL